MFTPGFTGLALLWCRLAHTLYIYETITRYGATFQMLLFDCVILVVGPNPGM